MRRFVLIKEAMVIGECWTSDPSLLPVDDETTAIEDMAAQPGWLVVKGELVAPAEKISE